MLIAKTASQRHTEHGHRKIIAILDVAVAFFHAHMEDVIYAHPPAEAEPDRTVQWLLLKAHSAREKLLVCGRSFLCNEVFMEAGWDAVVVEPLVYHIAGSLNDDDDDKDASVCVHGDDFMVESRIDVFQDVKAMLEHKRDSNLIAWAGLEQSKAAAPSPGTAATTKTMRNALEEVSWDRANAVSTAGGIATYLALDRPDNVHSIHTANQDIANPKVRTEA